MTMKFPLAIIALVLSVYLIPILYFLLILLLVIVTTVFVASCLLGSPEPEQLRKEKPA